MVAVGIRRFILRTDSQLISIVYLIPNLRMKLEALLFVQPEKFRQNGWMTRVWADAFSQNGGYVPIA